MPQLLTPSKRDERRLQRLVSTTRLRSIAPTGVFQVQNRVIKFSSVAIGLLVGAALVYFCAPTLIAMQTLIPAALGTRGITLIQVALWMAPAMVGFLIGAAIANPIVRWVVDKSYASGIGRRQ